VAKGSRRLAIHQIPKFNSIYHGHRYLAMTEAEFEDLFDGISLPAHLKKRLTKVCVEPEGEVEAKWVHRLIAEYLYHPNQLDLQAPAGAGRNATKGNVVADIVVYRDKKRTQPFIVLEVKREGGYSPKDAKQAESYARNLGADYHTCSDWITTYHYKTARYIDQSTQVGNTHKTWTPTIQRI